MYHNGVAIFHEGMKYWSCCEKKTSDFSVFLEQKGCTTGKHCWAKVRVFGIFPFLGTRSSNQNYQEYISRDAIPS